MKGELFFFNSNYNIPEGYNKFKSGHIGISFDRDLSPKKIYGFGPIDTNFLDSDNSSFIEGIVKDDTNYFKQYFYECSSNSPLYKIKHHITCINVQQHLILNFSTYIIFL